MKVVTPGGETTDLGETETGPTIGIIDYSKRVTDAFGVTTVVERGFARRMSVRMTLPPSTADALQRRLASLRATAATWVADERFASLSVTGFFKEFEIDHAVGTLSYCSLSVEGLATTEGAADDGADPAPAGSASTLQLLAPMQVTTDTLVSATLPENDAPEWSAGTTYATGARVIKAATHRIYESVAPANIGNDPAGVSGKWLDIGPTNRWAMFDQALGTATTAGGTFAVRIAAQAVNAVALLDVIGGTVRVQTAGYDRTLAVGAGAMTFLDLPVTTGDVVVTIAGAGTLAIGTMLIGTLVSLGITEASPSSGITDFSRKEVDDFGAVTIVERAWAKRMSAKALIRTDAVDQVSNRIAAVRAKPSLWIGQAGIDSLTIYGFFKDFSIEVGENVSKLALTIEGLSTAAKVAPLQASVDWPSVGDPTGTKPADNATNSADPNSPFGPNETVGEAKARLAQARDDIEEIRQNIANGAAGEAAEAAAQAAGAARDLAEVAQAASETARDQAEAAYAGASGAEDAAVIAQNLANSSAQAAGASATAAVGSADRASTKADEAGSSATSASGFANTAKASSDASKLSADASATSASAASGSAGAAGTSASAAQTARVAARLGAALTLPNGFSPAERDFWIEQERNTDVANVAAYDASWFGDANYPVFATRAGETRVLATRGLFKPTFGHTYRVSIVIALVAEAQSLRSILYPGFIIGTPGQRDGVSFKNSFYLGHTFAKEALVTLTYDWLVEGEYPWARPRLHWNWPDSPDVGHNPSPAVYHVRSFDFEDVTAQKEAERQASASASSASSAAASKTDAGTFASAAQTRATEAATASAAAQGFSGTASTKASEASTSASNAHGSENVAATYAQQAAASRDAAGGSAQAAATSASTASAKSDEAGSSAAAAYGHAIYAQGQSQSANTFAGQAAASSAVATGAAAAAQSSAILTASTSLGTLNVNPTFTDWRDGEIYPRGYGEWHGETSGTARVGGVDGRPYAIQQAPPPGAEVGFVQTGLRKTRGWWVIEADVRVNGSFRGAGVGFYSGSDDLKLNFATDPDVNGIIRQQAENAFWTYRWRKLVYTGAEDYGARLYGFTAYSSFGDISAGRVILWDRIDVRPATDGEIAGRAALEILPSKASIEQLNQVAQSAEQSRATMDTRLSAGINGHSITLQQQAAAIADADGRLQGFWGISFNGGQPILSAYYRAGDGTTRQGVVIGGNLTVLGDALVLGSVHTGAVADYAINNTAAVALSVVELGGPNLATTLYQVTIETTGKPVLLLTGGQATGDNDSGVTMTIYQGGTQVAGVTAPRLGSLSIMRRLDLPAGIHTFEVRAGSNMEGSQIIYPGLFLQEIKK